ncbi:MAG: CYTH domain-containing protein [Xanthomonadales bacterium]|nr:CYTH domain-containing protein [Xanthomonadales bacterium]
MGIEIERKFLLRDESWRGAVERSEQLRQGYLLGAVATADDVAPGQGHATVRVRVAGIKAWLNIKQAVAGVSRAEYEYPLPLPDAETMLATLCGRIVEKTRHQVRVGGMLFEVDEFAGDNSGLVVAEVELPAADVTFARPPWLGTEVSALRRYYNAALADHPYARWSAAERAAGDATC